MAITIPVVSPKEGYLAYREELDSAVARVLASGWYILGPEVAEFERDFATYCQCAEVVGVGNGTDAISLALRTLEIGPGDIVLTVSHTAVATVAAIEVVGAVPVLVDVNPETLTIDVQKLADTLKAFSSAGRRVKAVVAVHIYGHPCDMEGLHQVCSQFGVLLIEDCAQAHGASSNNKIVGGFGAAACFSFYPTKNLGAFGDAGAVAFQDPDLAQRCRALREYGWRERYLSEFQGLNSRLDELQAALLSVRLRYLDQETAHRRELARAYDEGLRDLVRIPVQKPGCLHSYHLYVIRTQDRGALQAALADEGVGSAVHYPVPVHQQRAYAGRIELGAGGMAVTEQSAQEVLSLPMHGFLPIGDAERVVAAVRRHVLG